MSNPVEYRQRLHNFQETLRRINYNNIISPKATFSMNQFSDMSVEEFKRTRLMKKQSPGDLAEACLGDNSKPSITPQALPDKFDWREKNVVSPIKDQSACGSCWAFSVIGNIESLNAIKTNKLVQFSEQLIVDCSKGCTEVYHQQVCNEGCNGGWMWSAMFDVIKWGGVELSKDYPYTARDGTCKLDTKKIVASIKNYTCLSGAVAADEVDMQNYLVNNGPLSVALNAELMMDYSSGIIDPYVPSWECDPAALDHAVLIVGYGVESGTFGTTPFWIVRNSWGTSWGEDGYFRIVRGIGCCGINTAVVSAVL